MKFLSAFAVFLALTSTRTFRSVQTAPVDDEETQAINMAKDCVRELGLRQRVLDMFKNGVISNLDAKEKCVFRCMHQKIGFINSDGTFNEERLRFYFSSLGKTKVDRILSCLDIKGRETCETAYLVTLCKSEVFHEQ